MHYVLDLSKRALFSPERYARSIGVKVGKECFMLRMTNYAGEPYLVELGDRVFLSSGVNFVTHDGGIIIFRKELPEIDVFGKIKVGSDTYIGANTIILPGVTIGDNCVIGAGSVVTKSIPDNTVAAGVPCKFITNTDEYKKAALKLNTGTGRLSYKDKKKHLLSLTDDRFIQKAVMRREKD
ncbi:MAG: acyltransferase [Chloroflexi bacterium]|nr:acyltransferase [Chloroflexota bacterium]